MVMHTSYCLPGTEGVRQDFLDAVAEEGSVGRIDHATGENPSGQGVGTVGSRLVLR